MTRMTRNYLIILGVIGALVLAAWLPSLNPRVWALNDLLANDPALARYPYAFRVLSLDGDTASLSSPRSPSVPAVRFLALLYPHLAGKEADNPDLIEAQRTLGEIQSRAKELVLAQPDVARVQWVVDQGWYAQHGVLLQ